MITSTLLMLSKVFSKFRIWVFNFVKEKPLLILLMVFFKFYKRNFSILGCIQNTTHLYSIHQFLVHLQYFP